MGSWVPWDCNNQRDCNPGLPLPGHCTHSRLKCTQCLGEGGLLACPAFWLSGRLPVLHTSGGYGCSQGREARGHHLCTPPLPHYISLVFPQKELMHSLKPHFFVTVTQKASPDRLAGSQPSIHFRSTWTVCICILEKLQPEGLASFQSASVWVPTETPLLWDSDRCWHTLNNWEL